MADGHGYRPRADIRGVAHAAGCIPLSLFPDQRADIWLARISTARQVLPELLSYLDRPERRRLSEITNAHRGEAYAIGHGLTRLLLSNVTGSGVGPGEWQFFAGEHGKPRLLSGPDEGQYDVSLSYSSDTVTVAVGINCRIGVDVEAVVQGQIPWAVLSDQEKQRIWRSGSTQGYDEFLSVWTSKEAVAKCRGVGSGSLCSGEGREMDMMLHSGQFWVDQSRFVIAIATESF